MNILATMNMKMIPKNTAKYFAVIMPLLLVNCGGGGGGGSSAGGSIDCAGAPDKVNLYGCYTRNAQLSKSLSWCDKIPADFCWAGGGSNTGSRFPEGNMRDKCYATTAHFIEDPAVCGLIKNEISACLADDFSFRWKDECYSDLANVVGDKSICNNIKNDRIRLFCRR